jgi:hypothetical protein
MPFNDASISLEPCILARLLDAAIAGIGQRLLAYWRCGLLAAFASAQKAVSGHPVSRRHRFPKKVRGAVDLLRSVSCISLCCRCEEAAG